MSIAYQVLGEGALDLVVVPGWVSNLEATWEDPDRESFYRRLAGFCAPGRSALARRAGAPP